MNNMTTRVPIDAEEMVRAFLQEHAPIPRKTVNKKHSTYGWKHTVEKYSEKYHDVGRSYIDEDVFIKVARELGYPLYAWPCQRRENKSYYVGITEKAWLGE